MLVQDYMIFIMEENRMWQVQKKETFDIWTNNVCALKIEHLEDKCRVYVDYKGYNVIMPMGMWGFEDEIQDRKIEFEIDGEKGNFKSLSYVVKESDLKLFCDMIFFFYFCRKKFRLLTTVTMTDKDRIAGFRIASDLAVHQCHQFKK